MSSIEGGFAPTRSQQPDASGQEKGTDMTFAGPYFSIGWVIALIVLVLVIVLLVVGQLSVLLAALIGGLAISRLI